MFVLFYFINLYAFYLKILTFFSEHDIINYVEVSAEPELTRRTQTKEFFHFQNAIREAIGQKMVEPPNPNEHPRIKAMKAKARYRDKVKAKQAAKNGISMYTSLVSICCMGLGITPLNIGEMSYVALESIMRKYQEKEKYLQTLNIKQMELYQEKNIQMMKAKIQKI